MNKIKRGDIYYAALNPVIGSEQGGTRPVIILQNDIGNKHSPTVIIASITGRQKKYLPTHVIVNMPELPKDSIILLEQIRTIDKQRLHEYICTLSEIEMEKVEQAAKISLGISLYGEIKLWKKKNS